MSVISQQQYNQAVDLLSKEEYDKALKIIMQRHKYNQQYYQKRKLQHQQEKKRNKEDRKEANRRNLARESLTHTTKVQIEMPKA